MLRLLIILFTLSFGVYPLHAREQTSDYFGSQTPRTPYDIKYRKVETYLAPIRNMNGGFWNPSLFIQERKVHRYLEIAKSFEFIEEGRLSSGMQADYWQLPEETERLRSGDCEDLAIWLYCHLLDEGFQNIRFTLGFAGSENQAVHAWVTWYRKGETYILDPSRRGGIYRSSQPDSITYEPWYSYYFEKKWNHGKERWGES